MTKESGATSETVQHATVYVDLHVSHQRLHSEIRETCGHGSRAGCLDILHDRVFPALLFALISLKAGLYNPDASFLENSRRLLGKWAGTAVVIVYLFQWYTAIGNIVKESADFLVILLLDETPNMVFLITLLLLASYAVLAGGIESIGRLGEVFGVVCMLSLLVIFLMLIPGIRINNLLPVYFDHGWLEIVRASIYPLVFKIETVWMLAIVPFLSNPDKSFRTVVAGMSVIGFAGTMIILFVILVLSPEVAVHQLFPVFDTISFISIMNFIQNLEIVLVLVWFFSVFIRISLYLFLASHTTAELFRIRKWKRVVWVVAAIALVQAWVTLTYKIELMPILSREWMMTIFPTAMIGFPLLLFTAGYIRQKLGHGNNRQGNSA